MVWQSKKSFQWQEIMNLRKSQYTFRTVVSEFSSLYKIKIDIFLFQKSLIILNHKTHKKSFLFQYRPFVFGMELNGIERNLTELNGI